MLPNATCASCDLVLRGPLADRLWQAMLTADGLVEQLRAVPAPSVAPMPVSRPAPAAAPRVTGRTVPALLLALGGLLVFVAVSLFLAVTWTVLPLGVKALLMAGFTGAVTAGAQLLSRRGLRGSAEAIWALAGAVLALDVAAAWRAGLFGLQAVGTRPMTIAGGLVVAAFGLGALLLVRRTPLRHALAPEVLVVLAGGVVTAAGFWGGRWGSSLGPVVGVVVLAGVALGFQRLGARLSAVGATVLAVLTWLDVLVQGWLRGDGTIDRTAYWSHGQWWQLLAAALLATVPALVTRLRRGWRTAAALASLVALAVAGLEPGSAADTVQAVQACLVLLALTGLVVARASVWSDAARWLAGLAAVIGAALVVLAATLPTLELVGSHPGGVSPTAAFERWHDAASWTVLLGTVTVALAAWVVLAAGMRATLLELLPGWLLVGVSAALVGGGAPVWGVAAALGTAAVLLLAGGLRAGGAWPVAATAPAALGAVLAGVFDPTSSWVGFGLVALASVTVLLAPVVSARERDERWAEMSAALLGLTALLATYGDAGRVALALTLMGSATALAAIVRTGRDHLGWVGSGVLVAATAVRVLVAHTPAPELYALPAAAALLGVGAWRLARDPGLGSWRPLGSGLSLALLPSLVLSLGDPGSLRTALVVVGAGITLGVGLERRWQAPVLHGTAVLVVLALRFLLPLAADVLADPLGAWLLFGAAGGACLTVGVLWERSVANLRTAGRFVGSLR
ncbi:hypothetical protein D9V37_07350 [Nocardioides mangrovicus]|uniref:DUF2157 domain-containing protein n=1 Tax=Nocardioides mangrovicus TaxID=2478913 RepID=A0A3L8P3P2_9ACTN|nr:hypothetical protein D9V37_07350 [Nocardioides mangrovicus]